MKETFYELECQEFCTHIVIRDQLLGAGQLLKISNSNISSTSVDGIIITKSSEAANHIWPAMLLSKPQMH